MKLPLEVGLVFGYFGFDVSWHGAQIKHMRSDFVKEMTPEDGLLLLCLGAFCRGDGRLGADGFVIRRRLSLGLRKDRPPTGN